MNCSGWKIFRDIILTKSFGKAAKLNFITQPAASIQLKKLEGELGVKLIHRSSRAVHVTAEGARVLPHIEELIQKCEALKHIAQKTDLRPKGDVRIATIHSVGLYELSPFMKESIRNYPDIQLHLQYRPSDVIYDLVRKNEIDLGIVAYPQASHKVCMTPFRSDEMVLVVPVYHRLAKRKRIRLSQIAGENFVAFDQGIPTGDKVRQLLKDRDVRVNVRMVNENIDTLKNAVEVGLGISIVPRKTVEKEIDRGILKAIGISDVRFRRPLGILTAEAYSLNPAAKVFLKLLIKDRDALNPDI